MTPGWYTLDKNGNPVPKGPRDAPLTHEERTVLRHQFGPIIVSTVFLSLDHRHSPDGEPVLWETLVFGGSLSEEGMRYTSRADAIAGHWEMIERLQQTEEGALCIAATGGVEKGLVEV